MKPQQPDWERELRRFPLNPQGVPRKLKQKVEEQIAMGAIPKRNVSRTWAAAVLALLAAAVLVAEREPLLGLFKKEKDLLPFDDTTERTLKVQWGHGASFMSQFGEGFIIRYPNMDVETLDQPPYDPQTSRTEQYAAMIEREQPDVVYLPLDVFLDLADQGMLAPLEPLIDKNNFKLSDFHEGVVDSLREAGGGSLYGLTPHYRASALYYNKTLFDRYGIPYPSDRMTWEDTFRLAQRFPRDGEGENRVYGFSDSAGSPFYAAEIAGWTNGLRLTDAAGERMTADSAGWKPIWSLVADGLAKGWLYVAEPRTGTISGEAFYKRNGFSRGSAALFVGDASLASDLVEGRKKYSTLPDFEWNLVSEPVDPANPNASSSFALDFVYAIPANAPHMRDGWEMLKWIVGEPMAKKTAMQRSGGFGLSARKDVPLKLEGYRTEAFTLLQPGGDLRERSKRYTLPPQDIRGIAEEQLKSAAAGTKTLDEAIQTIQQNGQQALYSRQTAQTP